MLKRNILILMSIVISIISLNVVYANENIDSRGTFNRNRFIEMVDYETGEVSYTDRYLRISNEHWDYMKQKFKKGQILITDDATTLGYTHGHAAILVSKTHTVEHLGKNTTTYSGYYDVSWWQTFDTIKSFNYKDSTIMTKAADYAKANLQNLEYYVAADRTSKKVNCATLVWKAYNAQGVNIVDSTSGTVEPKDFDKSSKLSWIRSVGWNNVGW